MRIINTTKNTTIADTACVADTWRSRMVGLLGRENIPAGEALVITRCRSIHMFFMRFAIDVVFVDKNDRVVGLVENIPPFHLSPVFFSSSYVVELPAGTVALTRISQGDHLAFENQDSI
ncbi:MAG: DUF192 domain-containing protein [Candidatus Omnitrophica bacterium]|nr:DUF192 domain-containing protein [Candidatus Omnitrophota bacterium]